MRERIYSLLSKIISKPLYATIFVGGSILVLQIILHFISLYQHEFYYVKYIVPFIPPYIITRTARKNMDKITEYNFISDAEPIIMVGFPKRADKKALLSTNPAIVSESTSSHLNIDKKAIKQFEILSPNYLGKSQDREEVIDELLRAYHKNGNKGILRNKRLYLKTNLSKSKDHDYLLNSVLVNDGDKIKWQVTLIKIK